MSTKTVKGKSKIRRITPTSVLAEEEGTWTNYHGVDLKIGRVNNKVFKKKMLAAQKQGLLPNANDMATMKDTDENVAALAEVVADGLIYNWSNFVVFDEETEESEEVEYSASEAREFLTQDSDAREFVLNFASDMDNFHRDNVKRTLEKS